MCSRNLFAQIVKASLLEEKGGFSEREIIGNLLIYLFAGVSSFASLQLF